MDRESLLAYRDHLGVEISDDMVEDDPFVGLSSDSRALAYANDRRSSLGGPLPLSESVPNGVGNAGVLGILRVRLGYSTEAEGVDDDGFRAIVTQSDEVEHREASGSSNTG